MEIELSQKSIDQIAHKVMVMLLRKLNESEPAVPEMVSCKQAAEILHISPKRMRLLKDYFPHVKSGENKQGKLLFKRDSLLESYTNLVISGSPSSMRTMSNN